MSSSSSSTSPEVKPVQLGGRGHLADDLRNSKFGRFGFSKSCLIQPVLYCVGLSAGLVMATEKFIFVAILILLVGGPRHSNSVGFSQVARVR